MPGGMGATAAVDTQLDFSREEYGQRLAAVRKQMRLRGCDAVIVDAIENINYLTGFTISGTRYQACLVFLDRDPVMVLRSIDEGTLLDSTWIADYVLFGDSEDPVEVVASTLSSHALDKSRIGVELDSNFLTAKLFQQLLAALPQATPVDFSGAIWELRLIKSAAEIDCIRKAAAIADEAMRRVMAAADEGVGERFLAALAVSTYFELGASDGHLGPFTSGSRIGSVHGQLRDRLLERGDVLHVELVPEYRGYSARMMRSAAIGPPVPAQEQAMKTLVDAQDAQIAAMKPSARAGDVDRILRERVRAAGLRERFDNVSGYTLGFYGTPRSPRASDFTRCFLPDSDWLLEAGMVFHMYVLGGGLSLSETVLVAADGPQRLTSVDRKLFAIGS